MGKLCFCLWSRIISGHNRLINFSCGGGTYGESLSQGTYWTPDAEDGYTNCWGPVYGPVRAAVGSACAAAGAIQRQRSGYFRYSSGHKAWADNVPWGGASVCRPGGSL